MDPLENATQLGARPRTVGELILSHRKAWEYLGNILLALWSLLFLISMLVDFRTRHRPSSLLLAIFEGAVAWFSLIRPMPRNSNISLYDWSIALFGSLVILAIRPAPQVHDHFLLLGVQLFGMCVSLAGLFSLNKSFGLVAANRGVKTHGMYAVVRHPIYAGYFLSFGAYLAQNTTLTNVVIYTVFVVMELLRVVAEERVLSQDAAYAVYMGRTRWRVVPLIY
jgi:protein-S-isoprenylcysteine O-methyltransferase Ste14